MSPRRTAEAGFDRRREMEILWRALSTPIPDAATLSNEFLDVVRDLQELQAQVCARLGQSASRPAR